MDTESRLRHDGVEDARPQRAGQGDRQQHGRKRVEHVHHPHDQRAGPAARVARQDADGAAHHEGRDHRDDAHEQREARAQHQARQHVAPQFVGAQRIAFGADGPQALEHRRLERVRRRDPGRQDRHDDQRQDDSAGGQRHRIAPQAAQHVGPVTGRPRHRRHGRDGRQACKGIGHAISSFRYAGRTGLAGWRRPGSRPRRTAPAPGSCPAAAAGRAGRWLR
ncbi:hypothetical protein G6F35_014543 [Rhizopus arrhizus]|nr:hypothetical protein G6F35_014543 [Rhizopus arrhizus]